jgi:hypothetical protein
VGLDPEGRYLLALSFTGRGLIDCRTGEKVARDYDKEEDTWLDQPKLIAKGIGPLEGSEVRAAGIYGGGLPTVTEDDWRVERAAPTWPNEIVWCEGPESRGIESGEAFWKLWEWDSPFAFGFSESGLTLVIACSNDVRLWTR